MSEDNFLTFILVDNIVLNFGDVLRRQKFSNFVMITWSNLDSNFRYVTVLSFEVLLLKIVEVLDAIKLYFSRLTFYFDFYSVTTKDNVTS